MAYVAVTGGREAIEQSLKLLEIFRDSKEDMTVSAIKENMGLLIDKIMSEAGFYSQEYAALALKQCEGSVEEAVFHSSELIGLLCREIIIPVRWTHGICG